MSIRRGDPLEPGQHAGLLRGYASLLASLLLLAALYGAMFQHYRAYEIDNPWYLSFSRNWWVERVSTDFFLNGIFPNGMGGTVVFGRIAAIIQGLLLTPAHWTASAATAVSTALVLAGLAFWFLFLQASGFTPAQCGSMVLALGLTEPFVGMADRFRYEPVCFLLMAAGFWFASRQRPALGLLLAFLAAEVEPAGMLSGMLLLLYLYRSRLPSSRRQFAWHALLAGAGFLVVYAPLHPHVLRVLATTDWNNNSVQRQFGGFLRAYFVSRKRHLPELSLLGMAAIALGKNYRAAPPFVRRAAELLCMSAAFSFVMNWPTPAYMIFFYPFVMPVCLWTLNLRWNKPWLLSAIACLVFLPQYAFVTFLNRGEGFDQADQDAVTVGIAQAERQLSLNDEVVQIMGDYTLWFAHPNNYRALSRTTLDLISKEDLFLCFDSPLQAPVMTDPIVRYCAAVQSRIPTREVGTIMLRSHPLHILAPASALTTTPATH